MSNFPNFQASVRFLLSSLEEQLEKVPVGVLIRHWEWLTGVEFPFKDEGRQYLAVSLIPGVKRYDYFFVTLKERREADSIDLKQLRKQINELESLGKN
uniref:Uncharacterized protein n=1 Tax=Tetranychus urticae TaxID=32264 RepID=T1KSE7_TETUR